jgi:phage terminase small subunit
MATKLTENQMLFCQEYLVDRNGTQAAIRAGYSEKTAYSQGHRLLNNAEVLSRVRELQREQNERLCVDADWVSLRLIEIVERCMQARPVLAWDREEKRYVETGEYQFDSRGANRALELLGKRHGMFADRVMGDLSVGITGEVAVQQMDLSKLTDEELDRLDAIVKKLEP